MLVYICMFCGAVFTQHDLAQGQLCYHKIKSWRPFEGPVFNTLSRLGK